MSLPEKVTAQHLKRNAYLYVRQSTLRQVFENCESTERQYALRQRAVALGWAHDQIVVIDSDLGQSGASASDRKGFQQLVTEVSLGRAGMVMGLEVSRLARNSSDWHRLLELCALGNTLILDEDGIYNPAHFNDRLLLGLKGTMSEAELHVLHARLFGGILNKARRGELWLPLPVGLVFDPVRRVVLDPDKQVQETIRYFFETFRRVGSAFSTVRAFKAEGILFPKRIDKGPHKGELLWVELTHACARRVLHSPRYAGAYCFGRKSHQKLPNGHVRSRLKPRDEWIVLLPDAHEGYITWEQFDANEQRLQENSRAYGHDRRKSPAREGPSLLQGLVICGKCGQRMTVRYHQSKGRQVPEYSCRKRSIEFAEPVCQVIVGDLIDAEVGALLVKMVSPLSLEVALLVRQELQSQLEEAVRLRMRQVERVQYEADLARRRYMQVDPANRLVADILEAEWNQQLRDLQEAQKEYDQWKKDNSLVFTEEQRSKILSLASDFPKLWKNPKTPQRERKRMIRLLIEDVTLFKDKQLTVQIRFKGGTTQTLQLPLSLPAWKLWQTSIQVVEEIDQLLDRYTPEEIAKILNKKGYLSGKGNPFHRQLVYSIQDTYGLKSRYDRLREKGLLTLEEIGQQLNICMRTVKMWRNHGFLKAYAYNDKNQCLYEDPGDKAPIPGKHKGMRGWTELLPNLIKEVQYET